MAGSSTPSKDKEGLGGDGAPDPARELAERLRKALDRGKDKARGRVFRLRAAEADVARADELRLYGETLKARLAEVPRGVASVRLPNMFGGPDLEIPLEPKKSALENMQEYFRQHRKALRGQEEVARRLAAEEKTVTTMEQLTVQLDAADHLEALRTLEERFRALKLLPRVVSMVEPVRTQRRDGPRHFVSADGADILVGRSAEENAQLSFRLARGNDWWLHVQHQGGGHVVVRCAKGKELTQETLLDAAHLAAYHSKARGRAVVDVTYTQAKHVTRPRKAPVGTALVAKFRTIRLTIDPRRMERLMAPLRSPGEE
ncbi:MAG: fibronectin/fibrinogen-binding protein [Candidatus Brocadiae bacterium]|nr:fibronectin/fibrinogen-binding protein [Candidatus Brocadiia bacterium]